VKKPQQEVLDLITDTIIRHAGLSEWDRTSVEQEAKAIIKALKKKGLLR